MPGASSAQAVPCGLDSYSPGLRKQTTCNACPAGTHTDPDALEGSYTSQDACLAGPGSAMGADGATPCQAGFFKEGYTGLGEECSSCAQARGAGLTTAGAGAASAAECKFLELGYAAVTSKGVVQTAAVLDLAEVTRAKLCPQGYVCRGGDPRSSSTVQRCTNGLSTQAEGASDVSQCLAPPGYRYTGSSTVECETGFFKANWDRASDCTPCGTAAAAGSSNAGWMSGKTTRVPRMIPNSGALAAPLLVRGSAGTCCEWPASMDCCMTQCCHMQQHGAHAHCLHRDATMLVAARCFAQTCARRWARSRCRCLGSCGR